MHDSIYPLEFLFDGRCPLCRHDVAWLGRRDRAGRLQFIDVSTDAFDPTPYGCSREALLARIHARRADGVVVQGPEVFRLALAAVGHGWLVVPTRWPGLRQVSELAYSLFARHRSSLSRHLGGWFARRSPACDAAVCQRRGD